MPASHAQHGYCDLHAHRFKRTGDPTTPHDRYGRQLIKTEREPSAYEAAALVELAGHVAPLGCVATCTPRRGSSPCSLTHWPSHDEAIF